MLLNFCLTSNTAVGLDFAKQFLGPTTMAIVLSNFVLISFIVLKIAYSNV